MPTSNELIVEVRECVLGASYSDATILRYLNRAQGRIAGMVILPDLATDGEVTTDPDLPYVDLPADYHRELHAIESGNAKSPVKIHRSWIDYKRRYPLATGRGASVDAAAIRGTRLYYQPIVPATDTLTLFYHRRPRPMVNPESPGPDDQVHPDGIPEHLAEDLLINYAAMELWKLIEQDDANQPNVQKYSGRFNQALAELMQFVEPDGEPVYIQDEWGFA